MVDDSVSGEAERSERQAEQQNQSGGADESGDTDMKQQEEVGSEEKFHEIEVLIEKAQTLIGSNPGKQSPTVLRALSSVLESQESRYIEVIGHSALNSNGWSSHKLGCLRNLIRVRKKLSELICDFGNQTSGSEQNRWQMELAQVAIKLIGVATNSECENTLAATEALTPTLRDIERATPKTYNSRELLLLLIHEHLQASGLGETASILLKEAQMTALPSLAAPSSLPHQASGQDTSSVGIQWPSAQTPKFLSEKLKEIPIKLAGLRDDAAASKEKVSTLPSFCGPQAKLQVPSKKYYACISAPQSSSSSSLKFTGEGLVNDSPPFSMERLIFDSLLVQYLKNQHRQCPAPINNVYFKPRRSPSNVTSRLSTREFQCTYGGIQGSRKDRQFVYSGFRLRRTYLDYQLFTCISFYRDSSRIVCAAYPYTLQAFDVNSNTTVDGGWFPDRYYFDITYLHSHCSGDNQLVLCSTSHDVHLYDASLTFEEARHSFDNVQGACFSNSGTTFAASSVAGKWGIRFYDVETCKSNLNILGRPGKYRSRGRQNFPVRFSPSSDKMVLWNGALWDCRDTRAVHWFDGLTNYGGGGFHPARNEIIINSEIYDVRNFKLLQSVPSLDNTDITFNSSGDVIYAIFRRDMEDINGGIEYPHHAHPLFRAFRTVDALNYSDIATIPVNGCIYDFATEPSDLFVGLITLDDGPITKSTPFIYEIGCRDYEEER